MEVELELIEPEGGGATLHMIQGTQQRDQLGATRRVPPGKERPFGSGAEDRGAWTRGAPGRVALESASRQVVDQLSLRRRQSQRALQVDLSRRAKLELRLAKAQSFSREGGIVQTACLAPNAGIALCTAR